MIFQAPGQSSKNIAPNCLRDPLRDPPGSVPGGPRRPKEAALGKSGPRTAKTAPRGHQERLQRWSKKHQKWTSALGWPPGAPGSHFGPNFEPPGSHFRAIFERMLACIFDPPALNVGTSAVMAWLIKGGRRCWRSHSQYNL